MAQWKNKIITNNNKNQNKQKQQYTSSTYIDNK